ncbi:MAG: hypothetical protein F6K50_02745 [Moorea sp. SIO3I7]|uniref:hypothetical protein n=1 Tax=Moorena sp. SIO3I8 TaxID=2607833 RepID=UPI0013BECFC7|nr:hypothetical protein [Moorena sp. SIO3I8]NEN94480.1 hypothetical protein [Moorena sp. SIO3I7]NEO04926.1 hypothetical protein [Moorena sp. SIO3I8]
MIKKGEETRFVHAVDLPGWLNSGWEQSEEINTKETQSKPKTQNKYLGGERLYKDGESVLIHSIDVSGWLEAGWKTEAQLLLENTQSENSIENAEERASEIASLPWQEIQKLADRYGVKKPQGTPWKDLAHAIAERELMSTNH